jgi:hypothetical protein
MPPSRASSAAESGKPDMRAITILDRAGSPIRLATTDTSGPYFIVCS